MLPSVFLVFPASCGLMVRIGFSGHPLTQTQSFNFADIALVEPLQRAVRESGYTTPTPIQIEAIPPLLEGRDLLGCAQTGTGKTAAFALPILQRLAANRRRVAGKHTRVLVLTPTRELAIQVHDSFRVYGEHLKLKYAVVYGGVGQGNQVRAMSTGVDILVATPGRLLDLIDQRYLVLDGLEVFVLDEADRMLDMGFIQPIRQILALLPKRRQTLFFSATMPPNIEKLAASILTDPVRVEVTPVSSTAELIAQSVMFVDKARKKDLLLFLFKDPKLKRVIIFTRTKNGANRVADLLDENGVSAEAIHGNKSQSARQRALENFREGKIRALVATDLAARGIDVDNITHVINFEVPNVAESYVHRIGRTARAGAQGIAISLCDAEERSYIRDIERLIGQPVPVASDQPFHSESIAQARGSTAPSGNNQRQQRPGRNGPAGGRPGKPGRNSRGRRR